MSEVKHLYNCRRSKRQKNAELDCKLNLLDKKKKDIQLAEFCGLDQVTYLPMEIAIIISVSDFQILFTKIFCYRS